jgi:hypothetical protein
MKTLIALVLLLAFPYLCFSESKKDKTIILQYSNTLLSAVKVGKNMAKLIKSGSKSDYAKCINTMDNMQPKLNKLNMAIESLPTSDVKPDLMEAIFHAKMCVVCTGDDSYCIKAENLTKDAIKYLKNK